MVLGTEGAHYQAEGGYFPLNTGEHKNLKEF